MRNANTGNKFKYAQKHIKKLKNKSDEAQKAGVGISRSQKVNIS